MTRFRESRVELSSFADETLVVCPTCSSCAISRQLDPDAKPGWFAPRRLACTSCAHVEVWAAREIRRGWRRIRDDYFGLPLWLQVPCCGETLWAYSERHLDYVEQFVSAKLRERRPDAKYGWSNASLISRMPAWMKSAKHRDEILKGLARLRERLPDAP